MPVPDMDEIREVARLGTPDERDHRFENDPEADCGERKDQRVSAHDAAVDDLEGKCSEYRDSDQADQQPQHPGDASRSEQAVEDQRGDDHERPLSEAQDPDGFEQENEARRYGRIDHSEDKGRDERLLYDVHRALLAVTRMGGHEISFRPEQRSRFFLRHRP